MLRTVAERLRLATRPEDQVGRIGGDEFVVICPHGGRPLDPDALVRRMTEAVCGPVTVGGDTVDLQASIGAAASEPGEVDAEALLGRADQAMYQAKGQRRPLAV